MRRVHASPSVPGQAARRALDQDEPELAVDLTAVAANYWRLERRAAPSTCAAVVKADAYGLGMEPVARALAEAGCREFCVATADEGRIVRQLLPDVRIYVLHGVRAGLEPMCAALRLVPVLHDAAAFERWCTATGPRPFEIALKLDTGMNRLGFSEAALHDLLTRMPDRVAPPLLVTHLACGAEPEHPMNRAQLDVVRRACRLVPGARASIAATAGLYHSREFFGEVVRPGAGLFGIRPSPHCGQDLRDVITLTAGVVQVRDVPAGEFVGYDATFRTARASRFAVLRIGYGDGLPRRLGNRGSVCFQDTAAPMVGEISMDLTTVDVTDVPRPVVPGERAVVMGGAMPLERVAAAADTTGYDLLTSLGGRVKRRYSATPETR